MYQHNPQYPPLTAEVSELQLGFTKPLHLDLLSFVCDSAPRLCAFGDEVFTGAFMPTPAAMRSLAEAPEDGRLRGVVLNINRVKKYGFIRVASGKDYFFHTDQLVTAESFRNGALVEFSPLALNDPDKSDRAIAVEGLGV